MRRLLQRNRPAASKSLERYGNWVFDRPSSSISVEQDGEKQRFELTEREFRLALALFRKLGQAVSRAYLMESMGHDGELACAQNWAYTRPAACACKPSTARAID
ncbi:response regulator transcription factor [Collimonas humicola]|uniref:response regulator transcription factor n=1 Tax=Collimonas humicola TaxID=2825886 RepID=UPI001B8C76C4|nr:response regulator transcription factor [Collimonas humicola]